MLHRINNSLLLALTSILLLCSSEYTSAQSSDDSHSTSSDTTIIQQIAFGSCANQQKPCPIWGTIADYSPQVVVLLGDNVYADILDGRLNPATPNRIAAAYDELNRDANFQRLRNSTTLLATWDDHDYGNNDAGREWIHKQASARLFHDFFGTPLDAPERTREGVYNARIIGPPGKRVQFILLDTRHFRTELTTSDQPLPGWRPRPYVKLTGADAQMLGEEQWQWFEEQLQQPAELRIIGSSIQVITDEHPFEMWGNFPDERQRFYDLIKKCEASGVIVLSGDRHLGEISLDPKAIGYPLFDVTASGLNQGHQGWRLPEPNSKRFAALPFGNHFGTIEVDWEADDPQISLQLRLENGEIAVQTQVPLSRLQALAAPLPRPDGVLDAKEALQEEVGSEIVVQFAVRGGRDLTRPSRILLNSEQNIHDESNLTIVVESTALTGNYADAKLSTFNNRTVRAKGRVTLYSGRKQLTVARPADLEIVQGR